MSETPSFNPRRFVLLVVGDLVGLLLIGSGFTFRIPGFPELALIVAGAALSAVSSALLLRMLGRPHDDTSGQGGGAHPVGTSPVGSVVLGVLSALAFVGMMWLVTTYPA